MARITKAQLEAQVAALQAQLEAAQAQLVALSTQLEAERTQRVAPAPRPAPQRPALPNWQAERVMAMAQAKELAMRLRMTVKVAA